MAQPFAGRWKLTVVAKNAGFAHRLRIAGATTGSGAYPSTPGTVAVASGPAWTLFLEWNDGAGSGWRESAVARADGYASPLIRTVELRADDNFESERDNDFDDLIVLAENQDAPFDVIQRPAAVDRSTLVLFPDGIFEAGQGVAYMAVRVRNTFTRPWSGADRVRIGIAGQSRMALATAGITVLDAWTGREQEAFGQQIASDGCVITGPMRPGDERTLYFKLDLRGAGPGKPTVGFVARCDPIDARFESPPRIVSRQIFITRSTYNPATRELHARLPEGDVFVRLNRVMGDPAALQKAIAAALAGGCRHAPPRMPDRSGRPTTALSDLLRQALAGEALDPCAIRNALLNCSCEDSRRDPGGEPVPPGDDGGGRPGSDDWCRYQPFGWLPVEFEYRVVPAPPYGGQFGPLAFEDPWWKVILIILAVLLAAASLIYDYIYAGQDPDFIIGTIAAKSGRATSNVDAATALLNGSRARDLGLLDAQGDDRNNGLPIDGTVGGTLALDRTDNGDRGIIDAVPGNVVFKSGARSGTTRGTVSSVSLTVPVDGVTFTNQVFVLRLAAPSDQPLSQAGDSGSLWVDLAAMRPVALNFAGTVSDDGSNAIANPIRDVVTLFDLHFNS
jgi:hypothetical protein